MAPGRAAGGLGDRETVPYRSGPFCINAAPDRRMRLYGARIRAELAGQPGRAHHVCPESATTLAKGSVCGHEDTGSVAAAATATRVASRWSGAMDDCHAIAGGLLRALP